MIGKLTGIVSKSHKSHVLVDVHDVGYLVNITDTLLQKIKPDVVYTFFIYTHVREDALDLYGFTDNRELTLFELLLTVSGIGPKTALSIVGRGASLVEQAVQKSDVDFFITVPRLGKKNAQKIIIELKNKLGGLSDLNLDDESTGETNQIVDALLAMGFRRQAILEALKKIDATAVTIEQKMRQTIKLLGR